MTGRPPIGERAMTAAERQRRYRTRLREERVATEARERARSEARREARLRQWEQELEEGQVVRGVAQVALVDFRDASPQQIAQIIVDKTWGDGGDKARQIADALVERIAEDDAKRGVS